MDRTTRHALRAALHENAPWLAGTDLGPRAVDAGWCERCDLHPRVVPTCGPTGVTAVCAPCAVELGEDGWCDGHRGDAEVARRWVSTLPENWAELTVRWWLATGEVRSGDLPTR